MTKQTMTTTTKIPLWEWVFSIVTLYYSKLQQKYHFIHRNRKCDPFTREKQVVCIYKGLNGEFSKN